MPTPMLETERARATERSMLDEILAETKIAPTDDGYDVAKKGVEAFLAHLLSGAGAGEKVDKVAVDMMIAEIDRKLSAQIDAILAYIRSINP